MDRTNLKNQKLVEDMSSYKEIFWMNPYGKGKYHQRKSLPLDLSHIEDAEARLQRFSPYLAGAFPETKQSQGIIESELVEIPKMKTFLEKKEGHFPGRLFLKKDSHLPISGSIKARGGIYEVLKFAENIAISKGLLTLEDDYSILLENSFKETFSHYSVAVGSTGNLGLSIGIISAKLGFQVTVHMSSDARKWKKDLLRSKGVNVIEYPDSYQVAVAQGRKKASEEPMCHFVDDENSQDLFLGYSVAGKRILSQLKELEIRCDKDHPLFVYIPCGVGGAPGGVTFGLKEVLGEHVHIFFAEPTHAPAMTLGLITELHDKISCHDIGIDGVTEADGLAVSRPSALVSDFMVSLLDGCYTIEDQRLYPFLGALADSQGIFVEPSACASFIGPSLVSRQKEYVRIHNISEKAMEHSSHILWATGGSMVPKEEMESYYEKSK